MASGIRKAAILLMSLDTATATELLKATKPELVTEIVAELAILRKSGAPKDTANTVKEFAVMLNQGGGGGNSDSFVRHMLEGALGREKSSEIMGKVAGILNSRDPFLPVRQAGVSEVCQVLQGESAMVVSLVLMEMPGNKSGELLQVLDENIRLDAVRCMAAGANVSPEARLRVAQVLRDRLETLARATGGGGGGGGGSGTAAPLRKEQLRKVAILLRGLNTAMRDILVKSITDQDQETARQVQDLMVTWDDVPTVGDRSMQEALRGVDSRNLALALVGADSGASQKLRGNISERAVAMLEEETTLLSSPKKEDVVKAREEILAALRDMNGRGTLQFLETS